MSREKRRQFLFSAGVLLVSPLARAQQAKKTPRIGFLVAITPEPFWSRFREGLRKFGYVDGNNIQFELRTAEGNPDLLPDLAAELVRIKVDIIVAWQTPAVTAAKQATREIPIVMLAGDPVGTGLVASLARPGGNITGLSGTTAEMGAKLLELIRELLPSVKRVAVLANATDPFTKSFLKQIQDAGQAMAIQTPAIMVREAGELNAAFSEIAKSRADAVIVQPSLPRKAAIDLALKNRLPAVSPSGAFPDAGGLMSYAGNLADYYPLAANYVDKILKGAKPADLPVQQPTKFELIVNLKTAKALGIKVPRTILLRADRVIE